MVAVGKERRGCFRKIIRKCRIGVVPDLKRKLKKREELRMRIIFLASTTELQIVSFIEIRNTLQTVEFWREL